MQKVKFAADYDHWTPEVTTAFSAGSEETVTNEIAEAARAAGKLEESNGGGSDTGSPKGGAAAAEGGPSTRRTG